MGTLSALARKHLPASSFAGPDRSYPIPDRSHAANARARASQFASPAVKAQVYRKTAADFPGLGKGKPSSSSRPKQRRGRS